MFEVFMYAVNAILPLILLIAVGYALRVTGLISREFVKTGNKLLFRFVLPVMVTFNIYGISDFSQVRWDILVFVYAMILILFGLGILTSLLFIKGAGARGVIAQCSFRSNYAILGLPLVKGLVGTENFYVASFLVAFVVPLFSFLSVIALTMFSDKNDKNHSLKSVARDVVTNPLIIAAATGLLILLIRSFIPVNASGDHIFTIEKNLPFIYSAADTISKSATFLSLLVLGGLLDFGAIRGKMKEIIIGTITRTAFAPVLGLTCAYFLSQAGLLYCSAAEYAALIALFGAPVAISSAIMAAEMQADAELARQLVVWTSFTPLVTMFAFIMVFRYLGLL
ncbi:MAG: AEC family transporter [Oscillospiraceae bacterium]